MTRDQFNAAMEKILVFYQRPTSPDAIEDFRSYMDGLYGAMYEMEAGLFGQTCAELVKTLARGQKPMPSQFWAVYHRVSEALAVRTQAPAPRQDSGEAHLWMIETARRMGPSGALFVLEAVGKGRVTLPQDVIDILEDTLSQDGAIPLVVVDTPTQGSTSFGTELNSVSNY